ncbi:MAG: hypothetical protein H6641_21735 [Caldilineaceae bacterium]|nr:hypothetical protein [Caldilineaceae bacterium]
MALPEIEFELTSEQYELLGYPVLTQGHPMALVLEVGVLLPDVDADGWFAVQKAPLPPQLVRVGPATYAFSGQIVEAELFDDDGDESAILLVECGTTVLRVTCGPDDDGRLPYGAWETRYLSGIGRLRGILEEDFSTAIGQAVGATVWGVRRLVLTPGDPYFGQWFESHELQPTPFEHDLVLITARLHRQKI